jgi:hypothetical protein
LSCFAIRCRSCTPASTAELTGWLEARVRELREQEPQLLVRLTRLSQDLAEATIDDGWLIEAELPGEPEKPFGSLAPSFEEVLRDMRILGLDPLLLTPVRVPLQEPAFANGR